MAASIKAFREDFGKKAMAGKVVHHGQIRLPLGSDVTAVPSDEMVQVPVSPFNGEKVDIEVETREVFHGRKKIPAADRLS